MVAYYVIVAAAVAYSVYMIATMPKLPGAEEGAHESPNNSLNSASNGFRPRQGIPQCFGSGVSYPDFIQPSFYYYEGNIKKQIGVFCISEGEVEAGEVRVGDTNILDIPNSSATIFPPFTKPADEFLVIHQSSSNVDGQILLANNDPSVSQYVAENYYWSAECLETETMIKISNWASTGINFEAGDYIRVHIQGPGDLQYVVINGFFIVNSFTYNESEDSAVIYFAYADPIYPNLFYFTGNIAKVNALNETDTWVGWFNVPGEDAEEVLIHWQAPAGVRSSSGSAITLSIRFEIQNTVTDDVFTQDSSITKNTFDPQFVTTIFNSDNYPGMLPGSYKVRARRITNVIDAGGAASEQLKLEAFVSVTPYSVDDFGDVTTMLVQRRATLFSPDQSGQKINLDYSRLLPYYNRATSRYEATNLQPTNSFADAVAYTLIMRGGETSETVDLEELYAIQDGLSD